MSYIKSLTTWSHADYLNAPEHKVYVGGTLAGHDYPVGVLVSSFFRYRMRFGE